MADVSPATSSYKRLTPVISRGEAVAEYISAHPLFTKATELYASGKEYTLIKPVVSRVEEFATPYVSKYATTDTIYLIDSKVDSAIVSASALYDSRVAPTVAPIVDSFTFLRDMAPEHLAVFSKAREEYFALLEKTLTALREKAVNLPSTTVAFVDGQLAAARRALPEDSAAVMASLNAAWEKLAAYPSVNSAISAAKPSIEAAKNKTMELLEALRAYVPGQK